MQIFSILAEAAVQALTATLTSGRPLETRRRSRCAWANAAAMRADWRLIGAAVLASVGIAAEVGAILVYAHELPSDVLLLTHHPTLPASAMTTKTSMRDLGSRSVLSALYGEHTQWTRKCSCGSSCK